MTDTSHLDAIRLRLSHEKARLELAKTDQERTMRKVWVQGIERELVAEKKFLGITEPELTLDDILSDDELLRELEA